MQDEIDSVVFDRGLRGINLFNFLIESDFRRKTQFIQRSKRIFMKKGLFIPRQSTVPLSPSPSNHKNPL